MGLIAPILLRSSSPGSIIPASGLAPYRNPAGSVAWSAKTGSNDLFRAEPACATGTAPVPDRLWPASDPQVAGPFALRQAVHY